MSDKGTSEKGDLEVTNARSDTSISNKEVGESENEVVNWTPEEERRLVRKWVMISRSIKETDMLTESSDSTGLYFLL